MVVRMAVAWIKVISLLWLTQGIVAQAFSSSAKPGCENFCGDVEIPYPFGMGTNCYMGEWFSIDCNISTAPPKPFLRKIQREVTNIFLDGFISVNFPLISSCNSAVQPVNLTGSPFVFSQFHNKFMGVGCNNLALMVLNSSDENTTNIIGGCLSLCDNKARSDEDYNCNGIGCCQTTIPTDLKVFNIGFQTIQGNEDKDCKYGFLVNQTWFDDKFDRLSNLESWKFVSAVLEWTISEPTLSLLNKSQSSLCYNNHPWRLRSSFRNLSSIGSCYCKWGYEGNPYLSNGCHDINECQYLDLYFPNSERIHCVNFDGGFNISSIDEPLNRTQAIGIGVGASGLLILLFGGWWLYKGVKRRKKVKQKEKFFKRNGGSLLKQQLEEREFNVENTKLFDSKELEKATDRFNANRILGQGGQGTVYKGMLANGKIVAVKKSKMVDESKIKEFINEVVILSHINHRNIVKLMGCCLETEVPLLVYEFIPNGSLFNYLHHPNEDEPPLTWEMRMRIATEIAGALFYLHSATSHPIYHRDIKSSNILLDKKYRAKIADFGTSRSIAIDQTHLTTQIQGTFGYLDPEFFQSSQFTEKSDVYSFGVVVVELLTGQAPISMKRLKEEKSLAFYFIDSMNGNTLFDILDDRVIKEGKREDIILVANLAKRCLSLNRRARPTMKEVVVELELVQMTQKDLVFENNREVDKFVMTEETLPCEEDISMSTRSNLTSDTFRLLET